MTALQRARGRPQATSHAAIEQAAFDLFDRKGFESTTMDDIAAALGVGRRTLFRYYPSKNDIPWGQFDASLVRLRNFLRSMPHDIPISEAVHRAVIDFNHLEPEAIPQHRRRMALLLQTPALLGHSVLRHAQWRRVISQYVADRYGLSSDDVLPHMVGQVSHALALSAYEQWLAHKDSSLDDLLDEAMQGLRGYLQIDGLAGGQPDNAAKGHAPAATRSCEGAPTN